MLLDVPRDGVQVKRARVAGQLRPRFLRLARRIHSRVDIPGGALRDVRDGLARRRVANLEHLARRGEGAINEMAEPVAVRVEPALHDPGIFRRGSVTHVLQNLLNAHDGPLTTRRGDARRRSAP